MEFLFIKDLWDILKDAFNENYPLIIFVVLIVGLVFFAWWARGIYQKIKDLPCDSHKTQLEKISPLDSKVNILPCLVHTDELRDHKKAIQNHFEDKAAMKIEMAEIRTSITFMTKSLDALSQSLQGNKGIITDPFTQRQSPIQITPKGYEVVELLGLYDMVDKNWTRISYFIEENAISKNPYDIQQFLTEQVTVFPDRFVGADDLDKIKTEAYKQGLNLMSYMTLIAVIVRDRYFDEHNIDLGEVDKHDPTIRG